MPQRKNSQYRNVGTFRSRSFLKGGKCTLLILWCMMVWSAPLTAQPSNIERYQELALRCLATAPDTLEAFRLHAGEQMPYLKPVLFSAWQERGKTVYLADSTSSGAFPLLKYNIEEAQVTYGRDRDDQFQRKVTLALQYSIVDSSGRLLAERRCADAVEDLVSRNQVSALGSEQFPETQGSIPEAGWVRRWLEPAVLSVATAVGIYLFFSLRSRETGSEQ